MGFYRPGRWRISSFAWVARVDVELISLIRAGLSPVPPDDRIQRAQQPGAQQLRVFVARTKALTNLPSTSLTRASLSNPSPARNARASSAPYTRVISMPTLSNPAFASLSVYSRSESAPATQPTHSSMLLRIAGGTSPRTTTSETAKRPPGRSTRKASFSTRSLSPDKLITQFEMMTSTELSGSGMCSISPFRNFTLVKPLLRRLSSASASISSVMSRPYALPVGPTRFAESNTSMPPPEPRSSTVSPGFNSASAVGLPQPSEACNAVAGTSPASATSYRFEVIGSQQSSALRLPQQPLPSPERTRCAACPYFSRTTSFTSLGALTMGVLSLRGWRRSDAVRSPDCGCSIPRRGSRVAPAVRRCSRSSAGTCPHDAH